ncbi:hypothetical protein B0T26DRAFT_676161 [Lasiosphaeria miniovina]|uniref:Uncharacterized protein n=1 Tax=Lasiosphaeria miniovina TaxID=1954250 RepID=A0AA40AL93_9PEZI|nr:uncharacterized protein B0T26DRAFT_676161 [Lasiosphaeria miniovina]KAK0717928.1 hypothetical protein B0T26DRAFT_676161 [Lasiosphaeria miniovina]
MIFVLHPGTSSADEVDGNSDVAGWGRADSPMSDYEEILGYYGEAAKEIRSGQPEAVEAVASDSNSKPHTPAPAKRPGSTGSLQRSASSSLPEREGWINRATASQLRERLSQRAQAVEDDGVLQPLPSPALPPSQKPFQAKPPPKTMYATATADNSNLCDNSTDNAERPPVLLQTQLQFEVLMLRLMRESEYPLTRLEDKLVEMHDMIAENLRYVVEEISFRLWQFPSNLC